MTRPHNRRTAKGLSKVNGVLPTPTKPTPNFPHFEIKHSASLRESLVIGNQNFKEAYRLSKVGKLRESKEAFAKAIGIFTDALQQIDPKSQEATRLRNIRSKAVLDMKRVEQAIGEGQLISSLFNVGFVNPQSQLRPAGVDDESEDKLEAQFSSSISDNKKLVDELSINEIVGLDSAKSELRTAIEFNKVFPEYATDAKTRIVLYGPPGTGKTALAKAVAKDMDAVFMNVSSDQLVSRYFGESKQKVNAMFNVAKKKQKETGKPVIIFLDEVDDIAKSRDNENVHEATKGILNRLIAELDGFNNADSKNITLIASTNKPWTLDSAFLQRMDQAIYADPPDKEDRLDILKIHIEKMKKQNDFAGIDKDVNIRKLASLTEGYTGRELKKIIDKAKKNVKDEMMTIYMTTGQKSKLRPVNQIDFNNALSEIPPTISRREIERFERFSIYSKKK